MGDRSFLLCLITATAVALLLLSRLSPMPASSAAPADHIVYLPLLARGPAGPTLGGCQMFPSNNVWNARVDSLPVDPRSTNYVSFIGAGTGLHPDGTSAARRMRGGTTVRPPAISSGFMDPTLKPSTSPTS